MLLTSQLPWYIMCYIVDTTMIESQCKEWRQNVEFCKFWWSFGYGLLECLSTFMAPNDLIKEHNGT